MNKQTSYLDIAKFYFKCPELDKNPFRNVIVESVEDIVNLTCPHAWDLVGRAELIHKCSTDLVSCKECWNSPAQNIPQDYIDFMSKMSQKDWEEEAGKAEEEVARLKELLRWRDAEKEPPTCDYSLQSKTLSVEFIVKDVEEKADIFILYGGRYDRETKAYLTPRGLGIKGRFRVLYWRPVDMPKEVLNNG